MSWQISVKLLVYGRGTVMLQEEQIYNIAKPPKYVNYLVRSQMREKSGADIYFVAAIKLGTL